MKPDHLYKYLSLEPKYIRDTLSYGELYFSRAADFNDPFDCEAFFHFDGGSDEERTALYKESISALVQKDKHFSEAKVAELTHEYQLRYPTLEQAAKIVLHDELYRRANLSDLGVLCLSETGANPVMFSHYCSNHRGICVQFAVHPHSLFARAEQVSYQPTYPALDFFKGASEEEYGKLYLTKYDGWQYEKEWRVLDFKDGYGLRSYPKHLLTGVTFGIKTSDRDMARVKSWLRRRGHQVKLFKARQEPGTYQLKLEMLDEVGP